MPSGIKHNSEEIFIHHWQNILNREGKKGEFCVLIVIFYVSKHTNTFFFEKLTFFLGTLSANLLCGTQSMLGWLILGDYAGPYAIAPKINGIKMGFSFL